MQFEVFGLEVGSSSFPTSFGRVVFFATSRAFRVLPFGALPIVELLFFLSFQFSAIVLDMSQFLAIVASDVWVNARRKDAFTRSCCCRGGGHCGNGNVVAFLKSIKFELTF